MRTLLAAASILAAGCASGAPSPSRDAAPLFRTATVGTPGEAPAPSIEPAKGARDGVAIDVRFQTSTGEVVLAPRLTAFMGGRARVQVVSQTSYVADFDMEVSNGSTIVDPRVAIAEDGIVLDLTARPGSRGTALAFSLRTARLRRPLAVENIEAMPGRPLAVQLPSWERAEAEGVRGMEDGVWGLLARLPNGTGKSVTVLARVSPEKLEFDSKDEDARDIALIDPSADRLRDVPPSDDGGDSLPARAAKAALPESRAGCLELRALTLVSDLPAGSVVEADAAALGTALPLDPGHLRWVTAIVPGARAACALDETYVGDFDVETGMGGTTVKGPVPRVHVSGLLAEVGEDGVLELRWTTTAWERFVTTLGEGPPRSLDLPLAKTWTARAVPGAAPRLVVLAPLADGKVAGVLVRFLPEETLAR